MEKPPSRGTGASSPSAVPPSLTLAAVPATPGWEGCRRDGMVPSPGTARRPGPRLAALAPRSREADPANPSGRTGEAGGRSGRPPVPGSDGRRAMPCLANGRTRPRLLGHGPAAGDGPTREASKRAEPPRRPGRVAGPACPFGRRRAGGTPAMRPSLPDRGGDLPAAPPDGTRSARSRSLAGRWPGTRPPRRRWSRWGPWVARVRWQGASRAPGRRLGDSAAVWRLLWAVSAPLSSPARSGESPSCGPGHARRLARVTLGRVARATVGVPHATGVEPGRRIHPRRTSW